MFQPRSTPHKHFLPLISVRVRGLGKLENFNDLKGARTRDLSACTIVYPVNEASKGRHLLASLQPSKLRQYLSSECSSTLTASMI
jgi:hypothetical protein